MNAREAILAAADRLFSRHGYGLTGVDALAAEAGVTKRTLYKQFGSKAALFEEWLRLRDQRNRKALVTAAEAGTADPIARVLALFAVLGTLAEQPGFHGCPFSRALLEFGPNDADAVSRQIAIEHKQAIAEWVAGQLDAAGRTDPGMVEEVMTLYDGTLQRMAAFRSGEPARAAMRVLTTRLKG